MMKKSLVKKVALVTGGSRGIGVAIADDWPPEGAHVAITYTASEKAAKKLGKESAAAVGGQSRPGRCGRAGITAAPGRKVVKEFGRLDILVNNAGMFLGGKSAKSNRRLERIRRINVDGVVAGANAAVKQIGEGARIVNISSVLGERASSPDMGVYNASKFAVTGFSRSWAKDLGAKGILVNAVQPGPISTPR